MQIDPSKPVVIALCGHPGAGKTEFQEILFEHFGVAPIDTGLPLRDFGMRHLGLRFEQVFTQDGKSSRMTLADRDIEVREFLGELGNALEAKFGAFALPYMAMLKMKPGQFYSDASCRRDQGGFWKRHANAVVLEIDNPLAPPSPYEFDRYDKSLVDLRIDNHALAWGHDAKTARRDLEAKACRFMAEVFGRTSDLLTEQAA